MKKTSLYLGALLLILAITLVGTGSKLSRVDAQVVQGSLNGWGWSDNIGWISFNCATGGPTANNICSTSNYSVAEDASGNLTGYAWSDNIGWIQFGGLSGFPSGGGSNSNAKVDSTGALTGWARGVAGAGRTDGWDGWISLSGVSSNSSAYGLNFNSTSGLFSGYAWGSDVVGWLTFNTTPITTPPNPCNTAQGQVCTTPGGLTPSVNLSISPTSITTGTTATLSWSLSNIDTTKVCKESENGVVVDSNVAAVSSGGHVVGPFSSTGTKSYIITCTATAGAGGAPVPSNTVNLTITGNSSFSACAPVSNATMCSYEGTGSPLSPSSVVGSPNACTATLASPQPTLCQYYCNTGFRQLGKTCVLNSTIQEN